MSYFAAAFARTPQGWVGAEATLDEAEVVDDLTDLMREVAVESIGDTVLLLVEEDDEWFGVARLDGEEDPRVYVSAIRNEGLGGLFHQLLGDVPEGEPGGDPTLLDDLGVTADHLGELGERALPADALLEIAEQAGFGEEYDDLRG
ncbi:MULTISPECIES: tRNA adenosine deaminase-associated protein [Thermomonospora]|uniref:Putative tRNA adenosine deaminase-associated protein n=1 Tax=Thermomonospora cellulosilytica TaxID=1411118 RepID=A0A7W3R6E8_9ACTN|nr:MULTISPECIES: tRNA adenosine deaminase-associated protein [Thermomonospora]MBA9002083.1 putative tRNA adenosine deaminase-associated protein [Thermomonospora cellulosilytica]